jgi:flagellar basal body-associated protein FliL
MPEYARTATLLLLLLLLVVVVVVVVVLICSTFIAVESEVLTASKNEPQKSSSVIPYVIQFVCHGGLLILFEGEGVCVLLFHACL